MIDNSRMLRLVLCFGISLAVDFCGLLEMNKMRIKTSQSLQERKLVIYNFFVLCLLRTLFFSAIAFNIKGREHRQSMARCHLAPACYRPRSAHQLRDHRETLEIQWKLLGNLASYET